MTSTLHTATIGRTTYQGTADDLRSMAPTATKPETKETAKMNINDLTIGQAKELADAMAQAATMGEW